MPKNFKKNIVFSKSKLDGIYRYKDEFIIYPIDLKGAPTSSIGTNQPLCIEYYYDDEEYKYFNYFETESVNLMASRIGAESNKRNRILNLLTAITNHRFHSESSVEHLWSIDIPEAVTDENNDEIDRSVSKLTLELYVFPGMGKQLQISDLSNHTTQGIKYIPHKLYYLHNPIDKPGKIITFPDTITVILDKYYDLDHQAQLTVDSACYQICNAVDLIKRMKSLSFFSAVSAIETMVEYEYKGEKIKYECGECKFLIESDRTCNKCGRPKWGIAEKFREFLLKYISSSDDSRKVFNKIYSIRSKIAHTKYLIFNEHVFDLEKNKKTDELFHLHMKSIQLARMSITNWLLKKNMEEGE